MAEHHESQRAKAELIAELDRARAKLSRNFDGFRHDIDIPAHFKNAVREHKAWWITGAAGLGLLLAKLPSRKKKVYVDRHTNEKLKKTGKAGLVLALAKMAFSAAKPMITAFATKKIADFARHQGRKEAREERHSYS